PPPPPPPPDLVLRFGDSVHVNGKTYTREEWDKIKDDPVARAQAAEPVHPETRSKAASEGPRAATCRTTGTYDEFPAESEKFSCSGDLGSLTREEILRTGWKVDLIEKLPAQAGEPATSARGLPLNRYKLILSR
ncbi:MAG TPA: hypothetical protein VEU32_10645, partial [Burkholderiales bacterium]|nr:hypothetical protein [Burkholderiales bacterium]